MIIPPGFNTVTPYFFAAAILEARCLGSRREWPC